MVCMHRSFMPLGPETSSSHWDTTPVVVGAVVEGGKPGDCLEGPPGGTWVALAGAMDPGGWGPLIWAHEQSGAHPSTLSF